jgi:DNA-binding transcriptional LysR family regulator
MLPSHSELEYFVEVCSTLNFSRASERLGISQPSLSMAMRRLETTLGAGLFIRHKQGVTLTQAGKQLLVHVRQLLQYWENTQSQALASENEVQGSFTLGCPPTIAIYMVSLFFPKLLENHPDLTLHLTHDISRRITERVIDLAVDFGIVANPVQHPDLIIKKLCNDQVTFWVGPGKNKTIILCDPELTQTQILLKKCKKAGINAERIVNVPNLNVVASLCDAGAGIAILPTRVAKALYPESLRPLPNAPIHSDEICLIYRNELRQVRAVQAIVEAIKNCVHN